MPRFSFSCAATALLILFLAAGGMMGADDPALADPLKQLADKPAVAPGVPTADAPKVVLKPTVNTAFLSALKTFSAKQQWPVAEKGTGNIRVLLIGGAAIENLDKGLALGNQALDGLEAWTGGQETFIAKAPKPEDIYWICVFASPGQVSSWIDHLRETNMQGRPEGEDLMKKLLAFPGDRTYFTHVAHVGPIFENFAVYCASCMSLDAYYQAHGIRRGPTWLREGMAAELQRTLCRKILCTTIAYEDKAFPMSESWARDVANLIKKGDRQVRPASELMRLKLDTLANVQYQQLWSLCSFVRSISGAKKGPENKFRRLLETTATGSDSETAMKAVFKLVDPGFSKAWCEWAALQK
ncbi:MAG: hypothetical protein H0V44_13985 [Planctomycetes bacterium]|nr:hypothetical protein [Planctomycetota bacterium]